MLRVCANRRTCVKVTHHRCNRPQKLNSLSRQVQCDRTPSASTFRSVPNALHSTSRRLVTTRHRHVIQNAGGPAGGITKSKGGKGKEVDTLGKKLLVGVAFGYLALVLVVPTLNVFVQAFSKGIGPFIANITEPDFLQAVKMTLLLSAVAVPINTVFGVTSAILISRNEFPGKLVVMSMLDLPFSISPVVTGLMLVLLYGREGWFAPLIRATGFNIVFAFPGMALATLFVTMPFVVRELIPILDTMDLAEEEAARTMGATDWQVFWNVTLPNIRYGLLYGIILTNARAMGEFGAVSVISGNIIGKTQTLTLFVEGAYKEYNTEAAFSAAVLLSFLAVVTLFVKGKVEESAE
ncbi:Sulfate permease 2, chloroplastic [Trebouxia sp. C0009 RCD-2024]